MKKMFILAIVLITVVVLCLITGCAVKKYTVDYCGVKQMYNGARDSYVPGASVKLYYKLIATDTNYTFYLDGEKLSVEYDSKKGYCIRFTMPDHDVRLECSAKNTMVDVYSAEEDPETSQENQEQTRFLSLIKAYSRTVKQDEKATLILADSKYATVTMHADDTAAFPALAEVLERLASMQKNSMDEEFDTLVWFAEESLAGINMVPFRTQISSLDVQIRRADNRVVSLLVDSYTDYGLIEGYRAFQGITFDSATGRELTLGDVIRDTDRVVQIIKQELNSHMWSGDFRTETAVEDYFANTSADAISWTLDYNGITFYFMPGDLCEPGFGCQMAKVSFTEHPEVFEEKYISEPKAYITELSPNASFFADLDGENDLEELICTGFYDEENKCNSSFGLYSDTDGQYYYEEVLFYDYHPYYVKTADNGHYLYLFLDQTEEGSRNMLLKVFDISDGFYTKVGEMQACPGFMFPDSFIQPTDLSAFRLDNRDTPEQEEVYTVGENGMPVLK